MEDIVITEKQIKDIADSEAEFCLKVRKCDPYEGTRNLVSGYKDGFRYLEIMLGKEKLYNSKILEIGSGNGFLLCYAIKAGISIVGVEPGKTEGFVGRHHRAEELLHINEVYPANKFLFDSSGENLPFADNSFDVVFSVAVLEHVLNLQQVMKESIRVLKPGGILLANIPNYNSFYEGHYNIFWLPYMNKNIAKLYVNIFKRDASFIDQLNFTTPSMFRNYLNSEVTQGKIYFSGKGLPGYIFLFYSFCCRKELIDGYPNFRGKAMITFLLRNTCVRTLLKWVFFVLIKTLQIVGFATVFDMILYKKKNNVE